MIFYPLTECPDSAVYPVPRSTPQSHPAYVKVGCRRCDICMEEQVAAKQAKWGSRLRERMLYQMEQGDRTVFITLTVHDDDYPEYPEMKKRISKLMNALRMVFLRTYSREVADQFKYWSVLEFGAEHGRLHAHLFLFLPKEVVWAPHWAWIHSYWRERYKAYIHHCRLVSSIGLAVWYSVEYATKQFGRGYDRMQSSQFGWMEFMEVRKKQWLGIPQDSEGVAEWAAFRISPALADALKREDVVAVIKAAGDKDLIHHVGQVTLEEPALHPFSKCWTKFKFDMEDFKCSSEKLNLVADEVIDIPHSLLWVPVTVKLQQLVQLRLAKLSLAVQRFLNSTVCEHTLSTARPL